LEDTLRNNIIHADSKTFGSMVEIIVGSIKKLMQADNNSHDRFCPEMNQRIEVKAIRAFSKSRNKDTNIAEWMLQENPIKKLVTDNDKQKEKWEGGICQIKTDCFDILFYAVFFHDKAYVFSINPKNLLAYAKYSKKQHRGGQMGQFHITNKTLEYHLNHHLYCVLNYDEIVQILQNNLETKTLEINLPVD
jgi:hypothetical protein